MRFLKKTLGLGLMGVVALGTLAGFAKPAAADVEFYFTPPGVYVAPPAPWGYYRPEPRYYYYDHGYYGGGWRHDGRNWRYEQGYWR